MELIGEVKIDAVTTYRILRTITRTLNPFSLSKIYRAPYKQVRLMYELSVIYRTLYTVTVASYIPVRLMYEKNTIKANC